MLETATGKVSLPDFKCKSLLLFFGYTTCPDICPTGLITLTDALEQLEPEEKSRVAVLFVSVDPARDTPAHLAEFTAFFDPAIIGATASPGVIADLARRYGVIYHFAENGAEPLAPTFFSSTARAGSSTKSHTAPRRPRSPPPCASN